MRMLECSPSIHRLIPALHPLLRIHSFQAELPSHQILHLLHRHLPLHCKSYRNSFRSILHLFPSSNQPKVRNTKEERELTNRNSPRPRAINSAAKASIMILTPFFPFARSCGRIDARTEFDSSIILLNRSSVNPNPGSKYLKLLIAGPRTTSDQHHVVRVRAGKNEIPNESISALGVPIAFNRFFSAFSDASFFANAP